MYDYYNIRTGFQPVSVAQDLLEVFVPVGTIAISLVRLELAQTSDVGATEEELLQIQIKRASGTYTSGSGGATAQIAKLTLSSSPNAVFTAERNNTIQASAGTGTLEVVHEMAWNVRTGMVWEPQHRMALLIQGGEALIVSVSAPLDVITMSAIATVRTEG